MTVASETVMSTAPSLPPPAEQRIFISGHSLTDRPLPDYLAAIAESLGTHTDWNQQNLPGSSLEARTRGDAPTSSDWTGYRRGKNRDGEGIDVVAELRRPQTIDNKPYDALVVTEIDALLDYIVLFDTVRYLRHFHDRIVESNPRATTYLYEAWLGIHDKDDPRRWIAYERAASPVWQCLATRINLSLANEARSDRIQSLPAASALASLVERATTGAGLPGVTSPTVRQTLDRLFADDVHLKPFGVYYVALVSYAIIYRRPPIGAWRPAEVSAAAATTLQQVAWEFVTSYLKHNQPISLEQCRAYVRNSFTNTYLAYQRDTSWRANGVIWAYAMWAKHNVAWRHLFGRRSMINPLYFHAAQDASYWLPGPHAPASSPEL